MISENNFATSPNQPALDELCVLLNNSSAETGAENEWPTGLLSLCGKAGVFSWFIGREFGGQGCSDEEITRGYLALSKECLKTAFIITQRTAATKRIESSANKGLKSWLLPKLAEGAVSTTVGISHLTTSRQHTDSAMKAIEDGASFRVNGYSPWVTGGMHADFILMGATLPDQRQILFVADKSEVRADPHFELMALTGSCTGKVQVNDLVVTQERIVNGPVENVMQAAKGAMTGGLQTSTLAIGLASAAIRYLNDQAMRRDDLERTSVEFSNQLESTRDKLISLSRGNVVCSKQELRQEANSLALRSTQAALVAAKGAGFVDGHQVGRWCRQAMFFLVWSCPPPVAEANLCELAGVEL